MSMLIPVFKCHESANAFALTFTSSWSFPPNPLTPIIMFLKAIFAGLLVSPASLAAQLTKVNYPNDSLSKVDM